MTVLHTLPINGVEGLPAFADAELEALRAAGRERFSAQGLPSHKTEAWKYTRIATVADGAFRLAGAEDGIGAVNADGVLASDRSAVKAVFVNGQWRDDLSSSADLPEGARLVSLKAMAASDPAWLKRHLGGAVDGEIDALVSLNDAAMADGFVLVVDRGVVVEQPIEIVHVTDGDGLAWFPRNLIVLGENTEATVIVRHVGGETGKVFVNDVTEVMLGDNAHFRHYTIDEAGEGVTAVRRTFVRLSRMAHLAAFGLGINRGLSRSEQTVLLEGEGAEAWIDGGYLLRGSAHCDNTTRIEHRVPHTLCNEVFKGVVDDTARAVFQGKIVVCRNAQHTDGQMLNKTLLLSDKAEIDTKPELEIYADDVKCAHGATSGKIDEAALFYLRSRGIPEPVARNLLVRSFLGEATDRIADEAVRDAVFQRIEDWLPDASDLETEKAA